MRDQANPYGEGYDAGLEGKSWKANPYPLATDDWQEWEYGWLDGTDDALKS